MQIASAHAVMMYCDAHRQYGVRADDFSLQKEKTDAVSEKNPALIGSALSAADTQKTDSSMYAGALKAPDAAQKADMADLGSAASSTISISDKAMALFQDEKNQASVGLASEDTESADLPALSETDSKTQSADDKKEAASDKTQGQTKEESIEEDPAVAVEINQLKQREKEVIAHEAAHKAVAGQYAGAVSYTYTTGPDDKRYITGGEVPIRTPSSSDPKEALRLAELVRRAALAPANPSSQDRAIAASASQKAARARSEIAKMEREDATIERAEKEAKQTDRTDSEKVTPSSSSSDAKADEMDVSGTNVIQGKRAVMAYTALADRKEPQRASLFSAVG